MAGPESDVSVGVSLCDVVTVVGGRIESFTTVQEEGALAVTSAHIRVGAIGDEVAGKTGRADVVQA